LCNSAKVFLSKTTGLLVIFPGFAEQGGSVLVAASGPERRI
jgi:hypothetical protein